MSNVTVILAIVLAAIIVVAVTAGAFFTWRDKRVERLRERFGPEYDHAVERADHPGQAESDLREREKRHQQLHPRTLDREERDQFQRRWKQVQGEFVDNPPRAVRNADRLVTEAMAARGYPVDEDFDQRADDLSVQHPRLTQRYRAAREIARANQRGDADTEQLRDAVTSYRALVHALLGDPGTIEHGHDSAAPGSHSRNHQDSGRRDENGPATPTTRTETTAPETTTSDAETRASRQRMRCRQQLDLP
jgi:hypothetical protein